MNKFESSALSGDQSMITVLNSLNIIVEPQTDDHFCHYDGIATMEDGTRIMVETKERYNDKYSTYVIEEKKIKHMYADCKSLGINLMWYINTFENEGYAIIWNINKYLLNSIGRSKLRCNATTAERTGKIDKVVYMLPKDKGFKVTYK